MSSSRVAIEPELLANTVDAQTTIARGSVSKCRKWKVYPGKNTFFCDGRCMCAPDWYGFAGCLFIYIVMGVLFFAFDCRYLVANVSPAIPVVGGILYLYILGALCAASLTDPGIVPRATGTEARQYDKQLPKVETAQCDQTTDSNQTENSPEYKEIVIKGRTFQLKYCKTCHIFRPPRAAHCGRCDNCVERFDHHCPMVGNCIGKRNYRHFYLFLCSVMIFAGYVLGCNITVILHKSKDMPVNDAVKDSVPTMIEIIVSIAALLIVGGFICFHSYLIATEITTNEFLKGTYSAHEIEDRTNPHRHRCCCYNFLNVLCAPKHPSLIDRRGYTQIRTV